MTTLPFHIEAQDMYTSSSEGIQTLEHLLNAWLVIKDNCMINQNSFSELCDRFELQKVNSYHDTRAKRFQKVIEERLLLPMFEANNIVSAAKQKQLTVKLCQWLIKNATHDQWLLILKRRLTEHLSPLTLNIERKINVTTRTPNTVELTMLFQTYSTDTTQPRLIFDGESCFCFQLNSKAETSTTLVVKANLFDEDMHQAFITQPQDEQVTQYVQQEQAALPDEEVEILLSARNYYLNKTTAQELQQHFISTNLYSAKFKNSPGYELLKAIFEEKPIKGLQL